ncbi:MAG: 1-pyrroline-5-carboxylate dehydrogenase [Pseudomonadota bacterium]|jgi:1-pyrroline-5-carboxylate dehydrogenase
MNVLSMVEPANEPIENIRDTETAWTQFEAATREIPLGLEVPMIIGGQKIFSNQKGKSLNPANKQLVCTFQEADSSHAQKAIDAALAAKPAWAALSPATRLQKFRDLEVVLAKWKYQNCATAAVECGYTANECSASWAELMDFVRFNSWFYSELLAERMGDGPMETNQLQLRPLKGFTLAVTPFNFPIAIGYNLPLVMALTGNTVVWKPSSDAVLTSYLLMLALEEAGFPPGVINFITGEGPNCLPTILKHPELSCLNFTGSFNTARVFGNYLFNTDFPRANFPRFIAETGGKDFLVADRDIDVVDTAQAIVQGAFGRSGQKCSANSVVLVDEKIWPSLKSELVRQTQALQMINPVERKADLGPVINQRAFDKIKSAIEKAKTDSSCTFIAGGKTDDSKGFFIEPTLIEVSTDHHDLLSVEIFGPVTAIRTYKTLDDAVRMIEQHQYRLTGSVISRNETFLEKAIPVLSQLAGNFYVNRKTTGAVVNQQPFGGDGASGTNAKAGGKWYVLNFVSQGSITRRHTRSTTPTAYVALKTSLSRQ